MAAALFYPLRFVQQLMFPLPRTFSSAEWIARSVYTRDLFALARQRRMSVIVYFLGDLADPMAQHFRAGLDLKYEEFTDALQLLVIPTPNGLVQFIQEDRIDLDHSLFIGEEGIEGTPLMGMNFGALYLVNEQSLVPALLKGIDQLGGRNAPQTLEPKRLKCVTDLLDGSGMLSDAHWLNLNLLEIALWNAFHRNGLLQNLCEYFDL